MAQVAPTIIYLSSDDEDDPPRKATSISAAEPRVRPPLPLIPHSYSQGTQTSQSPAAADPANTASAAKRQRLPPLGSTGQPLQVTVSGGGTTRDINRRFLAEYSKSLTDSSQNDLFVPQSTRNNSADQGREKNSGVQSLSQAIPHQKDYVPTSTNAQPQNGSAPSFQINEFPGQVSFLGNAFNGRLDTNGANQRSGPPNLHKSAPPRPRLETLAPSRSFIEVPYPPHLPPQPQNSVPQHFHSSQDAAGASHNQAGPHNPFHLSLQSSYLLPRELSDHMASAGSYISPTVSRPSSSQPRVPQNVEVISLDSDNEDEPQSTSVVNFVNNDTALPPVAAARAPAPVVNNYDDDDDDLMILDDHQAANVASKFNKQVYNGPAPVPHVSDPNFRPLPLIANQLQARITDNAHQRNNLVRTALKTRADVAQMQNMLRAATKTAANLKRQLISVPAESTNLSDSLRGLVLAKEEEIRRIERKLSNGINNVIGCEQLIRRIDQYISTSKAELERLGYHMPNIASQPSVPKVEEPRDHSLGYVPNMYSDDADLRNFIDSIRPDEENDELEATPAEMSINLMKHQRMGLAWLKRMEESRNKGGILADDMGLGKTVQTLAIMVANRAPPDECNTTVIIAPVSLLRQWAGEAESKIKPESALRIGIYHGADKKVLNTCSKMMQFDIILTSYGTLSSEWKRHFQEALRARTEGDGPSTTFMPKREDGGKSYVSPFFAQQACFRRIVLDEAQNIKNKTALASKAVTYMKAQYRLCLSGTPMQNKVDELFPFIRFLQIRPYHLEHKFRADISLPLKSTSGNYDDNDKLRTLNKIRALLKAILLRRLKTTLIDGKPILLLPEKHLISDYVDMDKDEKEYYDSLEEGIQMKAKKLMLEKSGPGASLNILTLLLRLRQACCHSFLVEIGLIKAAMTRKDDDDEPIRKRDWRRMLDNLRQLDQVVVDKIRLLGAGNAQITSSPRKDAEEEASVSTSNTLDNILRAGLDDEPQDDDSEMFTCPICYDVFSSSSSIVIFNRCGHMICDSCTDSFFESNQVDEESASGRLARCIECETKVKESELIDYTLFVKVHHENLSPQEVAAFCTQYYAKAKVPSNDEIIRDLIPSGEKFKTSAKIKKCIDLLHDIADNHPGEKVIIFSQFTTLFDVMKIELAKNNIEFMRFDGTMSLDQKNDTIKNFYQKDIKVLLLSLRAGNTGLTLTCASHVIIMDPFWNPYVEEQAMDRAYRIGQEREVYVHRILISGTVESRIIELQELKKEMVNAALDEKGMKNVSRLGQRELGFLFGLNSLRH